VEVQPGSGSATLSCELAEEISSEAAVAPTFSVAARCQLPTTLSVYTVVHVIGADGHDCGKCVARSCAAGEHVSAHACVPCGVGSTQQAGDLPDLRDTECAATVCGEDFFVQDHACVPCPVGKTRPVANAGRTLVAGLRVSDGDNSPPTLTIS
jgi:hypothetical protein